MEQGTLTSLFGINGDADSVVVEDSHLRSAIITASTKLEELINSGRKKIGDSLTSKTEWGLEIHMTTDRPSENKPIIFKYQYRINNAKFKAWIDEHKYLLGGRIPLIFGNKGINIMIAGPAEKWYDTITKVYVKECPERMEDEVVHRVNLTKESLNVVAHREVLVEQDWIVKCYV